MDANICHAYGLRKMRILSKCFIGGKRGYHKNKVIFVNCLVIDFYLYWVYKIPKEEE